MKKQLIPLAFLFCFGLFSLATFKMIPEAKPKHLLTYGFNFGDGTGYYYVSGEGAGSGEIRDFTWFDPDGNSAPGPSGPGTYSGTASGTFSVSGG